MNGHFSVSSNTKNCHWMEVVETLSAIGSVSGLIAWIVFQRAVFASMPLCLFVMLNLVNRRQLLNSIEQSNQNISTQLVQKNVETEVQLVTLTEQLAEIRQLTTDLGQSISYLPITQLAQENDTNRNQLVTLTEQLAEVRQLTTDLGQSISYLPITQLAQENDTNRNQLVTLTEQLAEVQRLATNLSKGNSHLQDYTQVLGKEQMKLTNKVSCLQEIETYSQTVHINPNDANAYYNRGSLYQRLGYKEAAIWDYTEAIRLIPVHAKAYHERGLTRANLGDKKGAIEDLREATKFFFEAGDILNYQKAREISKKFHELIPSKIDASDKVVADCLFS